MAIGDSNAKLRPAVRSKQNLLAERSQAARDVTSLSGYEDVGKMNVQLIANEENQDRAQCGENDAGGMISAVCWAPKQVGNGAADDRSDDAKHDRPEDRHVRVHHRFRDNPRD
jgi:hypothetical protein